MNLHRIYEGKNEKSGEIMLVATLICVKITHSVNKKGINKKWTIILFVVQEMYRL